ncbi:hypothetical protein CBR_g9117 [Chara braunii]|uniref:Uncharacterized protein n=1 Tax=Chara braunii TaxID=69332 RepID=A0A388KNU5_CHABU|nr:hypothetical protein CBR_g9117 [Chara braunii]|eukprot:GBG71705.1 hypothetical protein CBR_g9117 [Chara braunii]
MPAEVRVPANDEDVEVEDEDFDDPDDEGWVEEERFQMPEGMDDVMLAAEEGDAEALRQALRILTVGLDSASEDGDTALHLACLHGNRECVEVLLAAGASLSVKDEDGAIPLHDAAAGGYTECVGMLLASTRSQEELLALLRTADIDGDTPLHHAARGQHLEVVEQLVAAGADPRVKNKAGKLPGQLADPNSSVQIFLASLMQSS